MEERSGEAIRVVVVSPYQLPRLALTKLVEDVDGVHVVGQVADVAEAAREANQHSADVVLLDVDPPDVHALDIIGRLRAAETSAHVLLLTDRPVQAQIERALEAGATGLTLKDITLAELSSALHRVAAGDAVLHPDAAALLARRYSSTGNGTLTPRQREILQMIAAGLENKQIARRLGIGVHTVKTHVSRVLHKLGAASRTEAVVLAMKDRLIS